MKNSNKIVCIVVIAIIIVGLISYATKKFNMELIYSNRDQIIVSNEKEIDLNKVTRIAKDILTDRRVSVRKVDKFSNSVEIIAAYISNEEKENLIAKINEECGTEIANDAVEIKTIADNKVIDLIKPYLIPGAITLGVLLAYFLLIYHNIGILKVIIFTCLIPIISELVLFSVVAIARIPFGRITSAIAVGVYLISIMGLTYKFQNDKKNLVLENKKENDE